MNRVLALLRLAIVVIVALTVLPAVAQAQAIGGTVRDTSGAVLPGVTVEAASVVPVGTTSIA